MSARLQKYLDEQLNPRPGESQEEFEDRLDQALEDPRMFALLVASAASPSPPPKSEPS